MVPRAEPGAGLIRLARPDVGAEELAEVAAVLESGQLTMGPKVAELEAELARACGVEHAVAVSSGTAALHLAVLALGVGPGDEVLVPAYTFPATANVVALAGATPGARRRRPGDVQPRPGGASTTPSRRGPAPCSPCTCSAGRSTGTSSRAPSRPRSCSSRTPPARSARAGAGMPCGGLGAMGCLSFHPRKIVTTGEGGAVTTSDPELADAVRRLRHHGIEPHGDVRHPRARASTTGSPTSSARVGIPQLRRLDELLAARARVAAAYAERLAGLVETPSRRTRRHARLAGVRRPARPPRRGARGAARRGDRGPDRHLRAAPASPRTATRASSPGRGAPSSARSRFRSTRSSDGERPRPRAEVVLRSLLRRAAVAGQSATTLAARFPGRLRRYSRSSARR